MKHLLITLISILLLSSPVIGQETGVLYRGKVNWIFWGWVKDGDEKKDGKYVGEIENRKPNGQGTLTWFNGDKYVGEFMDGKKNGQGTYTFYYGRKYVGEFMDGKWWKGTMYYKDGKIKNIYVNGKRTEP